MQHNLDLEDIFKLDGLEFIQSLLKYEQDRFDKQFLLGSVYEDINAQFGIFPVQKHYPKYFTGDLTKPKDKDVFVGINPGFEEQKNKKEQEYLKEKGLFDACCHLFEYFRENKKGLLPYYANIAGFLRRLDGITEPTDWDWFQANLINLEFIPYHSKDATGLRINNLERYRHESFEALVKIIRYLEPTRPVFINGFAGFERHLSTPLFKDVIEFEKYGIVWKGKIDGKYEFVGMPFLNRVRGGKDQLVSLVQNEP